MYMPIPKNKWKKRGPVEKELPQDIQDKIKNMLKIGVKKRQIAVNLNITYYKLSKFLKKLKVSLDNPSNISTENIQ